MAAEAIHLSALTDCLGRTAASEVARACQAPELLEAARLGSVFVDLPYFRRFPMKALCFALRIPQPPSIWGDIFHQRAPVAFGRAMLTEAIALREHGRRESADWMLAFALGYFSHLAVDTTTHPLINRMARARVRELGGHEMGHHQDIEKFQSILFHEERNGFDFMGRPELADKVAVDVRPLTDDPELGAALQRAARIGLGAAFPISELKLWARGYGQYVRTIAGPIGRRLAPEPDKRREALAVYAGGVLCYKSLFERSCERVERTMSVAFGFWDGADWDAAAIPEGSIDEPPSSALSAEYESWLDSVAAGPVNEL